MLRTTKGRLLSACLAIALSPGILTAQTPDTFDDPTPLTESGLTKSEVLQAFARLAYGTNPDKDAPGRLTR